MPPNRIRHRIIAAVFPVLAILTFMACGGGGDGGLMAGGGIGGTGISVGEVSNFGSVIVNDVDFDTEKAKVIVNGHSIGIGDSTVRTALALGMVVRVEGRYLNDVTGKADRIVFTSNIRGPVQGVTVIDSAVKILLVMGQTVVVDDRTRFKNTDFDRLAENNVIEVSGWPEADGRIRTTYVGKISDTLEPDFEVMVKGVVTGTGGDRQSFFINQLGVDISEIDAQLPAVGQLAIVRGRLDNNSVLVAAGLELEDELGIAEADNVEIEGIVAQVSSAADFILGTTAVQTDQATSYSGLTPDDIVPGARLLVKGSLTNRRLLADEIIAKDKVNIEGQVEEVLENQITVKGLDGLLIGISPLTKIFGDASELGAIHSGQQIKVLGYATSQNTLEAIQAKVKDNPKDKIKLQGPVADINGFMLTIFEVRIDTRSISDDGFATDTGSALSRTEFLNLVAVGDTVSVNGNLVNDMASWKGIELLQE